MNLLDSLLDAIVRLDGDALVMHVGEKPYVVTTSEALSEFRGPLAWGQVELSSRVLTPQAVNGMLAQILPIDQRAALEEFGATEFMVNAHNSSERFTIVAARGGDDIWLEIRREPKPVPQQPEVAEERFTGEGEPVTVEAAAPGGAPAAQAAAVIAAAPLHTEPEPADQPDAPPSLVHPDDEPLLLDEDLALGEETLTGDRDWGDDVMTEGDLGELLRASAVAALTGEAGQRIEDATLLEDEEPAPQGRQFAAVDEDPAGADPYAAPEPVPEMPAGAPVRIVAPADVGIAAAHVPPAAAVDPVAEAVNAAEPVEAGKPDNASAAAGAADEEVNLPGLASEALRAEGGAVPDGGAAESGALLSAERAEQEHVPPAHTTEVADPVSPAPGEASHERSIEPVGRPRIAADDSRPTSGMAVERERTTSEYLDQDENEGLVKEELRQPAAMHESSGAVDRDEPGRVDVREEVEEAGLRRAAVVLPLSRHGRADVPADIQGGMGTLERVLRLAAARGAATLYFVAQSTPMVRVDGEFSALDGEPIAGPELVERLTAELTPPAHDGAGIPPAEWMIDVPEIGRVRCMSFRDHRGPGLIFRIVPQRAISAEQLGLPAEVQALCSEADGLVLVAGGRGSGRSTLLTSFVDLINRTRSDHVITAEPQIEFVHENKRSFVSQREVCGDNDAVAAAVRAASREDPDVLIIEDVRTPELALLALEAAESGRLVFASVPAVSAISAVERLIEMFPPERREKVQASLASTLRGVIAQVLLRRLRGGRIAAREVLFNTPNVANLIVEGKTFQLPAVIESGRRYGMMPFAESLAALVKDGTVHPAHAYRKAPNRDQFMSMLRREGVDTSLAERLA